MKFGTDLDEYIRKGGEYFTYRGVKIPFSMELALRRGIFISGGKGSGKSNLMKIFANYLMNKIVESHRILTKGQEIKVIMRIVDSSQTWLESSIPHYQNIDSIFESRKMENPLDQHMIYNVDNLYPMDQKLFIGQLLGETFDYIVDNPIPYFLYFIIEESQLILPSGSLRALYSQAALRHITVGRNYDLGSSCLTQFPALVSTNVIKQAGLCYMGVTFEENDKRKLRNFVCWKKKKVDDVFPNLDIGEFIFLKTGKGSKAFYIKTPEFIPSKIRWIKSIFIPSIYKWFVS